MMNRNKNVEDPASRKRLKRKFLDRWENEGGKVCLDPRQDVNAVSPTLPVTPVSDTAPSPKRQNKKT